MKINKIDYDVVNKCIQDYIDVFPNSCKEHASKVSPMRYRWDIFTLAVPYNPIVKRIYEYANGSHIDTMLRKIFNHID